MINLIIKDIKNIVYDFKTLAVILLMPIVLMSILGVSLQGMFSESTDGSGIDLMDIAVVKNYNYEDERLKFQENTFARSDTTQDLEVIDPEKIFFEQFLGAGVGIQYTIVNQIEGELLLKDDKVSALIILPKNYVYNGFMNMSASVGREKTKIEIIKNTNNQFPASMVETMVNIFVSQMNGVVAQKLVFMDQIINHRIAFEENEAFPDIFNPTSKEKFNIVSKEVTGERPLTSFQYYSVAIMTMFLLYAASIGGKALLEEKKGHTLQRIEVSGFNIRDIAISNFVRVMVIAILQSIIMIVFTRVALSVSWGDLATVILTILCSAFAVGGLSALVSILTLISDSYFVANIFEFGVVNLMALVGGSIIPIDVLPKVLQKMNFLAINGTAIKMYLNGMNFRPLIENYNYILILLTTGFVFILSAFIVLKTKKGGVIA